MRERAAVPCRSLWPVKAVQRPFKGTAAIAISATVGLMLASSGVVFTGILIPRGRPVKILRATADATENLATEPPNITAESADELMAEASTEGASAKSWAAGRFPGVKPELIPDSPVEFAGFVDEEALRQTNTFPIPEEDLVQLAKAFLTVLFDDTEKVRPRLASDFRFIAPVVPAVGNGISGDALCEALGQFNIKEAVPDLDPQQYDFRTDPFEPNRVWFTARGRGTNTGPVFGALPATGKYYEAPPQSQSLTFNEFGEISKMTIGYVMDKELGTTGGLGGIFGILYGIGYGLPFPEAQPWRPSPIYRLLTKTGNLFSSLRKLAR
eukprot:TRINITY_DN36239_c0_g1_i1.p1 TRINITY_DN36239_c0_g1~~TRINITY_DN36239_c0_g1_i1.p1  ORF type:complete len:326 (+),score=36.31 TRINITY_DN36239_c0_g1_i1:69-1046(+)